MLSRFRIYSRYILACMALLIMAAPACAREIRVGIGFALAPYVIRNGNTGLEVEVIREALALAGHTAKFVYLPNLRLPVAYAQDVVDCVAVNSAYDVQSDSGRKGFHSATTVLYQNFAITTEACRCDIRSVNDLASRKVLGFNNAKKYLGPEYAAIVGKNKLYSELSDQSLQVRMLYTGRVQVVVSDKLIFLWWRSKMIKMFPEESNGLSQPLVFYPIFPSAPRQVTFSDSADRDAFNAGLAQLKKSGRYQVLLDKYTRDNEE